MLESLAEPGGHESPLLQDDSWFVYLLPLNDCSAFKVGFSCNPMQRIYGFSRRYFERFDLHRAPLLRLRECAQARSIEALLKTTLAANRCEAPHWVPRAAGGHTEWFSAVHFAHAQTVLQATLTTQEGAEVLGAFDVIQGELARYCIEFESWAWHAAQQISAGQLQLASRGRLRDWLDAYRFFGVALFADDPAARRFVFAISRC
jgi:hypothetical protein